MSRTNLIADTDLCVKCGLCLPHCPTYSKTLDENESPRGRIALIQGWARGDLEATPDLTRHIDRCLLCRSCESACPAYVPYGSLVDRFRNATGGLGKPLSARLKSAALRKLLAGAGALRLAEALMSGKSTASVHRLLRNSGLSRVLGVHELIEGMPEKTAKVPPAGYYPAPDGKETAKAALFLGCTANLLDSETADAALRVMNRLGVSIRVPETQTCCGALHWHAGDPSAASALMARNLAAFDGAAPIVGFASGCSAMLHDYREAIPGAEAEQFSGRIQDLSQFLAALPWPENLLVRPLRAKVCVHSPCTLRNVLRADHHGVDLLRRIPELEVAALPAKLRCCGAAGSYLLEEPAMAKNLREDVLEQVLAMDPGFLATSNPGCALHLRAGLRQRGRADIEVLHPATLIARQLAE